MSKKNKCTCRHLGQCAVNDWVHFLSMTYPDGTRVWRQLTADEQRTARVQVNVNGQVQKLHDPQPGDYLASDGKGNVEIIGKALDVERAIEHTQKATTVDCKALKFMWRKLHPVPKEDQVVLSEQCPEEEA